MEHMPTKAMVGDSNEAISEVKNEFNRLQYLDNVSKTEWFMGCVSVFLTLFPNHRVYPDTITCLLGNNNEASHYTLEKNIIISMIESTATNDLNQVRHEIETLIFMLTTTDEDYTPNRITREELTSIIAPNNRTVKDIIKTLMSLDIEICKSLATIIVDKF